MSDITEHIPTLYHPKAALVIYEASKSRGHSYVEYFDMDANGNPINAHPLTVKEAQHMAKALDTSKEEHIIFLKSKGMMPENVLRIDPSEQGSVMWFTKAGYKELFFIESLEIPNGSGAVPPLVWMASKHKLYLYALNSDRRPTEKTLLYHAPFFNVYADGNVCMGTVDIKIKNSASLEGFMQAWENYFFNSYFSHLMQDHQPIKGNCVELWKEQRRSGKPFPREVLLKNNKTLKNLIR